jgi:hypothetical protein
MLDPITVRHEWLHWVISVKRVRGTRQSEPTKERPPLVQEDSTEVTPRSRRPHDRPGISRPCRPLCLLPRLGTKCVDGGAKR